MPSQTRAITTGEAHSGDLLDEGLITIAQAAKLVPGRNGKSSHFCRVYDWVLHGTAGGIRLEAVRCGGVWYTSKPALRRFFERATEAKLTGKAPAMRTPRERSRAVEAAKRQLQSEGI
ncbi:MAG: DUF1580 domain-containing protein [Bacillota bacterium]